jgi:uncharacterized membrane protein
MMTYPSYIIANKVMPAFRSTWIWRLVVAGVGAMVMTAWDLVMDPMMVAGGHWVWEEPGAYFGIPLQNYFGWWLTTFITFWLFLSIARIHPTQGSSNESYNRLPILSYAILGISTILTDFLFGLGGPALVGIFAMLPWVLWGWWKKSDRSD